MRPIPARIAAATASAANVSVGGDESTAKTRNFAKERRSSDLQDDKNNPASPVVTLNPEQIAEGVFFCEQVAEQVNAMGGGPMADRAYQLREILQSLIEENHA